MTFFSMYKHNAAGVLNKSFFPTEDNDINVFSWFILLPLLPLTLTLGAFSKTLFDYFTRKPMGTHDIDARKSTVDGFNEVQMNDLVDNVLAYEGKSDSSYRVLEELRKLPKQTNDELKSLHDSYKIKLAFEQIDSGAFNSDKYKAAYLEQIKLNDEQQKKLDQFDQKHTARLNAKTLAKEKQLIGDYMQSSHNNGKKLLQIIMGLFTPEKRKTIDSLSIENEHVSYYQ